MGCLENITYERFPEQKEDLGSTVKVGLNGDKTVSAVIVRSDAEVPNRQILRTSDGLYIQSDELDDFKLPNQGNDKKSRAEVYFHYDTSRTLEGKIVRDDMEEPYLTLIELEDGRVISAVECQYRPLFEEEGTKEKIESPAAKDIALIKKQLRRRNSSERASLLHGIYKQLVPSRKGKIANGQFNNKYSSHREGHQHFVRIDWSERSVEALANQIVQRVATKEFVGYLLDEMRKYEQLQNHADRLEGFYQGNVQVDMLGGKSKPVQIKRI